MLYGWICEQTRWSECCVLIGYPNRQYEPSLPTWDIQRLSPKKKSFLFGQTKNPLFTKFKLVRSRCLDTGQIILAFHLPRLRLGLWKRKKKNMAIIQPSSLNKLVNNAHLFRKDNVCAKYLLWTQFLFKMGPLFPRGRGSHTWKFSPFAELM